MDVQATQETIKWAVNGVTILLMIIAASLAIKKKNDICLIVAIMGNLVAYYFTKSPLLCMIISIACIIWAIVSKSNQINKPNSEVTKSSINEKNISKKEKMIKCRFCKKSYSSEYNGCPYCKKV